MPRQCGRRRADDYAPASARWRRAPLRGAAQSAAPRRSCRRRRRSGDNMVVAARRSTATTTAAVVLARCAAPQGGQRRKPDGRLAGASAMPRAAETPTRRPVNLPGPMVTANAVEPGEVEPRPGPGPRDQRHQALRHGRAPSHRLARDHARHGRGRARRPNRLRARCRWQATRMDDSATVIALSCPWPPDATNAFGTGYMAVATAMTIGRGIARHDQIQRKPSSAGLRRCRAR